MNSNSASSLMPITIRTALRTIVLVLINIAGIVAAQFVVDETNNIGYGIGLFGVIAAISLAWGVADGVRLTVMDAILPWVPTAVITALLASVAQSLAESLTFGQPISSVLTTVPLHLDSVPFLVGLILVPAAVGITIGWLIGRASTRLRSESATSSR